MSIATPFAPIAALAIYVGAAVAEIAGCFSFWAWLRLGKSPLWLAPGMASLALFAFLLTRIDSDFAGRALAGGSSAPGSLGRHRRFDLSLWRGYHSFWSALGLTRKAQ